MGKLTASMVVDLDDRTGRKVQSIIGNLDRLKRAERDLALANNGARLSNRDRAMERLMIERERAAEERRARVNYWMSTAATGGLIAGAAAGAAYRNFADVERRINRIVVNADKGAGSIQPTIEKLRRAADDARLGFDETASGFETLIASGRSLEEALAFLPSVAMTAQASGAAIGDIALSADAMAGALNIDPSNMQRAFDILVAGGKAGKFELKDMSQYLPSLLPAFSALGYKGTDGLQKIVAMLQVMRNQAGSSSEAATYLSNVLNKMYSADTAKKFKGFGIDLPKALDKAKKEGKDLFEVFLDMTQLATKGDLSKLPLLFTDAEMQKGVRALITQRDALRSLSQALSNVDGTALKDFNQIAGDSAAKIQKLSNLWGTFVNQVGSGIATVVNPVLETVTEEIDDATARRNAQAGMDEEQRNWQRQDFNKRYREAHPDAGYFDINEAYMEALQKQGRGQAKTVFDELDRDAGRRAGGEISGRYPSRGSYDAAAQAEQERRSEFPGGDRKLNPYKLPKEGVPIPVARPKAGADGDLQARQMQAQYAYPSRGTYDPTLVDAERERRHREMTLKAAGAYPDPESDPTPEDDAAFMQSLKRFFLGKAADPDFDPRSHFGVETKAGGADGVEGGAGDDRLSGGAGGDAVGGGSRAVTIEGTPTVVTQPSGVQQVQVLNPVRPNVTISISMPVTIQQSADPQAIGRQIGDAVSNAASSAYQGGGADHGY